jgi:hypothetical protein
MYRLRNPVAVVDEIEFLMKKCDVEAVNFLDLSFTATPSHVGALCEEMMRRSLGLKWWCESRANTPLELLKVMKRAGCVSTVVGIESGSSRILSAITKGISLDQAIRFCKECAELGISVGPYFMYSLPGESKSDVVKTLDIINELERFTLGCSFQPAMIFPGTKLEKIAKAKGILPSDFSWCDPYESSLSIELGQLSNVPLFIDMLSAEDLRRLRKELPRMRRMRAQADHVAQMSVPHLIRKGLDVLIHRDHPSREYVLSPGFWREYIRKKLKAIFSPSKESPSDGLSS